jgi:hypothetical protein
MPIAQINVISRINISKYNHFVRNELCVRFHRISFCGSVPEAIQKAGVFAVKDDLVFGCRWPALRCAVIDLRKLCVRAASIYLAQTAHHFGAEFD